MERDSIPYAGVLIRLSLVEREQLHAILRAEGRNLQKFLRGVVLRKIRRGAAQQKVTGTWR